MAASELQLELELELKPHSLTLEMEKYHISMFIQRRGISSSIDDEDNDDDGENLRRRRRRSHDDFFLGIKDHESVNYYIPKGNKSFCSFLFICHMWMVGYAVKRGTTYSTDKAFNATPR
ncbi:hypothetical protein LINPERHAP2_LOCUS23934, partial [Linum perenne]